uniref:Uncharacterized protein n=1 Tax=Populus alba TaxID=43335 RepID=A0A4U5QL33_POPAL|nr:hypothetical protein D5086_0000074070 [Populus alba]
MLVRGKKNAFSLAALRPNVVKERERLCPIPDGLPKSPEDLEEEEKARMPDSPFTRMLRTKGRFPAWYTPALTMEQIDEQAASCHKLCRFFVKLVEMDVVVLICEISIDVSDPCGG